MLLRVRPQVLISVLFAAALSGLQSQGATLIDIGFDEMVAGSEVIVRATVVEKTCFEKSMGTGQAAARVDRDRVGKPPASEVPVDTVPSEPSPPVSVGTEGGRMIFTEIVLVIDETLKGQTDSTITLRYPGGNVGDRRAIIHGLPDFEPGRNYLLFLRPGYTSVGDPVVGVNQGFFPIVTDSTTGEEMLLDARGDYVIGVEQNRVVTRLNPQNTNTSAIKFEPPPSPDPGYENVAHGPGSPSRYRTSNETPLSPADMKGLVRNRMAGAPKEVR